MDSASERTSEPTGQVAPVERRSVKVIIFNQSYTLTATDKPGEVELLAHRVDELMTDISARSGRLDPHRLAVLACLHMADRLREAEQELAAVKTRVDRKARQLTLLLDQSAES